MNTHGDESIYDSIRRLLAMSLEGTIQPEQTAYLDTLLRENPKARRYYLECIHLHLGLRRLAEKTAVLSCRDDEGVLDETLWAELARNERTAEPIALEPVVRPKKDPSELRPVTTGDRLSPQFKRRPLYTVLAVTAALVCLVCYVLLLPPPAPIVGTLADAIDARWMGKGTEGLHIGQDMRAKRYRLAEGVVKVRFDSGAEVLMEAPCEFAPLSHKTMLLVSGKAFAHVPSGAIGFTIDTPQGSVVDLGTSFGVFVNSDQGSEVHVHQGKVNLVAGRSGDTQESVIIHQRQARKIEPFSGAVTSTDFEYYKFVQGIDSKSRSIRHGPPVCLADIVAGGDGLSNSVPSKEGIDPGSGQVHSDFVQDFDRSGSGHFEPVEQRRFVDGVFVPNGPTVVSSAGHFCRAFGPTAGTYWSDITTWPMIHHVALNEDGQVLYEEQVKVSLAAKTSDRADDVPRIVIHSNAGITFDLDPIRRSKNAEIRTFKTRCGVAHNVMAAMRQEFWVLLDGQVVYHHLFSGGANKPQTIAIPIRPENRFLTVAVTDGGDNTSFDWGIFESPILEMAPCAK